VKAFRESVNGVQLGTEKMLGTTALEIVFVSFISWQMKDVYLENWICCRRSRSIEDGKEGSASDVRSPLKSPGTKNSSATTRSCEGASCCGSARRYRLNQRSLSPGVFIVYSSTLWLLTYSHQRDNRPQQNKAKEK